MTKNSSEIPQRIIPHRPVDEDEFSGAHEKIAQALEKIITNQDQEGISIGLEGARGSGKSTILNILQKNISDSENIAFATIDTWSHRGDQLRRASLGSIVEALLDKRWIDTKKWTPKFSTTDHQKTYAAYGPASVTLLLLVAFWLITPKEDQALIFKHLEPFFKFLGSHGFGLPVLVFLLFCISTSIGSKGRHEILKFFRIFFSPEPDTSFEIATHQAEENSWLLQKWFHQIAKEALAKNNKRLVIIFDNLDRLEPKQASEAIQTLQIFLDELIGIPKPDDWQNRVFFICCYAREITESTDEPQSKFHIERHFEKILNVHFRTPLPPPKIWIEFAEHIFSELKYSEDVVSKIIQRIYMDSSGSPPTPRQIQAYANELIALKVQNPETICSDLDLLDYSIWSSKQPNILQALVDWHSPSKNGREEISIPQNVEKAKMYAGLYFGKPENEAYQALLRGVIETSLNERKGIHVLEDLADYAIAYEQIFEPELTRFLAPYCPADRVLETIEFLYGQKQKIEAHEACFGQFKSKVLPLQNLELMRNKSDATTYVRAIKIILEKLGSEYRASDIIDFEKGWVIGGKDITNNANSECWFMFHRELLAELSEHLSPEDKFVLAGDVTQCQQVAEKLYELWMENKELGIQFVDRIRIGFTGMEELKGPFHMDWFRWMKGDYDKDVIIRILERGREEWVYDIINKRHEKSKIGDACRDYFLEHIFKSRENAILAWDISPETREISRGALQPKGHTFPFEGTDITLGRKRTDLKYGIIELVALNKKVPNLNIIEILTDVVAKNPTLESSFRALIKGLKRKIQ